MAGLKMLYFATLTKWQKRQAEFKRPVVQLLRFVFERALEDPRMIILTISSAPGQMAAKTNKLGLPIISQCHQDNREAVDRDYICWDGF